MNKPAPGRSELVSLLCLKIATEQDVVVARQRARQLAELLDFPHQDQVGLATAVSEVARNVYQYAREGQIDFEVDLHSRPQFFAIHAHDRGPGIADVEAVLDGRYASQTGMGIGLNGTRRITERFQISTGQGRGTSVRFGKSRPPQTKPLDMQGVTEITLKLVKAPASPLPEEMRRLERELTLMLERVQARETELDKRAAEAARLNLELEETNRGVVALYAELEDKAAALRLADELKSRFLSHVSHEFRTPVNAIAALAQLLLRRIDGDLTPEQEKQVFFIRKAAEGLTEMVDDLLDLAKVEAGKTEIRNSVFEISQAFGAVRALMRPLATNEAVTLAFVDPAPGLSLQSDEAKVGQILRNLVSNALKFTEKGEVRVDSVYDEETDSIAIRVKDTGIGLAPENKEAVFREFSQISSPLQTKVKGTGLGLPLSRKLAELLGGSLSVESELGAGSTFILKLPRNIAAAAGNFSEVLPAKDESTVLIVDDEETSRYMCRHLFQGSRHRTLETGALEAAERARFERPDLIILDLMMPGRTGFEVLEELQSHPITENIPVIIHTSKVITEADLYRLRGIPLAILPKSGQNRKPALEAIRKVLNDDGLFDSEPEFEQGNR